MTALPSASGEPPAEAFSDHSRPPRPWAVCASLAARIRPIGAPNHKSRRVAERSGFQKEGIFRSFNGIDGRRIDCVIYSLLPSDLEATS